MTKPRRSSWALLFAALTLNVSCSTEPSPDGESGAGGAQAGSGGALAGATGGVTGGGGNVSAIGGAIVAGSGGAGGAALAGSPGMAGAGRGTDGGATNTAGTGGGGRGSDGGSAGSGGGSAYRPCPTAAGMPCTILPLGDSITQGYMPDSAGGINGGYRVELFNQAVMNSKNITFVGTQPVNGPMTVAGRQFPRQHEGRGGFTISGISDSVTDKAMTMFHPNIVLLKIGTNDINGNSDLPQAPTRLGALIDRLIAEGPDALIVVSTIIPIANAGTNKNVQTYNAALPDVVKARAMMGKHVILIDSYAEFVKDASYQTTLMIDTLHPNVAGYALLGRTWYGAIKDLLPAGP